MGNFGMINLLSILVYSFASQEKCMFIDYRGKDESTYQQCSQTSICKKKFTMSYVDLPPYSTAQILEKILRKCCGTCLNLTVIHKFKNISDISLSKMKSSHFIAPFLGASSAVRLYGYHFIPLVDVPSVFYFPAVRRSTLTRLTIQCLNLYPLIIVCMLMTAVSGFIVWIFETWSNEEQFPRSFVSGLFEGFFWSFVSITTVGYGDKFVKSIPARIFAVIWILTGIIMFGMLTALITAEIMNTMQPPVKSIRGAKVGALKFRNYDVSLIVQHGGMVRETSAWNFYSDVLLLISMLRRNKIDGFVLDKYTLAYTTGYLQWKKGNVDYFLNKNRSIGETYEERKDDIDFFNNHTYKTMKVYGGEKLSYGVLVKDIEDYNFLYEAVVDNILLFTTTMGSEINELFPRKEYANLFTASGEYYTNTIVVIAVVMCAIVLFGIVYELCKRKHLLFGNTSERTVKNKAFRTNMEIIEINDDMLTEVCFSK